MNEPRLYLWAVAFAAGVATAASAPGGLAAAPVVWAGLAALAAAAVSPRGWARWPWILALVVLAGAARGAWERSREPPPGAPPALTSASDGVNAAAGDAGAPGLPGGPGRPDDRVAAVIEGVVSGAIDDADGRRRFVVDAGERVWVSARAPLPDVLPGDRVVVRGRLRTPRGYRVPGAVDMRRLAAARGAFLEVHAAGSDVTVVERGAHLSAWRTPAALQRRAAARLTERGGDRDAVGVARAMIAGDRGGLAPAVTARFRDAGVAHVLAVSGLHLAVVALLAFAGVRRAWAAVPALAARVEPAVAAALAAAPAAIAFTVVTGARTSTLRALVVVLIVLAGHVAARRVRAVDALGAAALALLAVRPAWLWDPAFQLSFSAAFTLALVSGRRTADMLPRSEAAAEAAGATPAGGAPAAEPSWRGWRAWRGWAPRLERAGARLSGWAWDLARASLWASAATAPFTALAFGAVATGGVVANLAVVPAATLAIVPLGLLGSALAELGGPAGGLAGPLLDAAIAVAGWCDAVAGAVAARAPVLAVPPPTGWELAGAALVWTAAVGGARGAWRGRAVVAVAAVGVAVVAASAWSHDRAPARRGSLVVTFLDVGQGDAAVMELPGGEVWLIDSGGLPFVYGGRTLDPAEAARLAELPGERAVARFLAARRIRRIDVAVITHPHPDHYAGLRAVARAVPIGELWTAREVAPDDPDPDDHIPGGGGGRRAGPGSYRALVAGLRAAGTRVVHPRLGEPVVRAGVSITALAPRYLGAEAAADPVMSANDNSLVLMVERAGRRILFAGDVEREAEELLRAESGDALRADVVKVPHHGSRTSSTPGLVNAVRPRWAVISCGVANRFGFPAPEVVARWQDTGARVLRTDLAGSITVAIEPDGAIAVTCFDPDGQSECRAD